MVLGAQAAIAEFASNGGDAELYGESISEVVMRMPDVEQATIGYVAYKFATDFDIAPGEMLEAFSNLST